MFTTYLLLGLLFLADVPAEGGTESFAPEILVQARAIRVVDVKDGKWQEATFRIEHVYRGDAKLKGMTFHKHISHVHWGISGISPNEELEPPVKEGEVGIWQLDTYEDRLIATTNNQGTHISDGLRPGSIAIPVPARKIIGGSANNIDYGAALKWARLVETVTQARPAERPKLLREQVSSDNPYMAAWSIRTLVKYNPADTVLFLKRLVGDSQLSVAAQVTIDDVLCDLDRKKWRDSKQRLALLQRWVSGDIIERRDTLMIAVHLTDSLERHALSDSDDAEWGSNLDWDVWLPLMEKWIVNNNVSSELEHYLYSTFHNATSEEKHRGKVRDRIVAHAVHLLRTSRDESTQVYAARWLDQVNDLTAEQLATVNELKDKATNERVRSYLQAAIKGATRKRRG